MDRLRYVEQELAKKRGKNIDTEDQVENEVKRAEDELYKIPEHLKVSILLFFPTLSFCSFHSLAFHLQHVYATYIDFQLLQNKVLGHRDILNLPMMRA